jgi:hypothetical protein
MLHVFSSAFIFTQIILFETQKKDNQEDSSKYLGKHFKLTFKKKTKEKQETFHQS